jgi:carbon-monoxide dehydrogenase medium subunit
MTDHTSSQLVHANSVDEAIAVLSNVGTSALPVAGGTWVMRAPIRQEATDRLFVSLGRIHVLKHIESNENEISIGSLATHDALSKLDVTGNDLNCLIQAALKSANPAIRNAATIGGNICTSQFAAADLVPALLCLGARVEIQDRNGSNRIELGDYLSSRDERPNDEIMTKIIVERSNRLSAHARLLMRQAGDYPVVNLSCSLSLTGAGMIKDARIAVGSVETSAKRWCNLEVALSGHPLSDLNIKEIASTLIGDFHGRDGPDAPGLYRVKVLPKVAAQALESIQKSISEPSK